jgi:hypothetical protein
VAVVDKVHMMATAHGKITHLADNVLTENPAHGGVEEIHSRQVRRTILSIRRVAESNITIGPSLLRVNHKTLSTSFSISQSLTESGIVAAELLSARHPGERTSIILMEIDCAKELTDDLREIGLL